MDVTFLLVLSGFAGRADLSGSDVGHGVIAIASGSLRGMGMGLPGVLVVVLIGMIAFWQVT
jgi:hypothetical protein